MRLARAILALLLYRLAGCLYMVAERLLLRGSWLGPAVPWRLATCLNAVTDRLLCGSSPSPPLLWRSALLMGVVAARIVDAGRAL